MPSVSPAELMLAAASQPLMREVFGNIPGWAKGLFYVVAAVAVGAWAYGIYRRVRLWRQGKPSGGVNYAAALKRVVRDVLLQGRFRGRPFASLAHVLLFSGFFVLLIGTTLVAIEHILADLLGRPASDPVFHKGLYYAVYELVTDSFGVAFLVGCTMFLVRRLRGAGSFAKTPADVGMLVLLIVIGVTGYVVEGLRIIHAATPLPGLSPVGYVTASLFTAAGVDQAGAGRLHFALWWFHAALALGFIAWMPYSRLIHSLAGAINLAIRNERLGTLRPISMAEVEETGLIGVAKLEDFTRQQLASLDACVSCGRCQDMCPAFEAGKPLSPRNVVQELVGVMNVRGVGGQSAGGSGQEKDSGLPLAGGVIGEETLWSCTTCGACADVCPLGVSPMGMITDLRRFLIGDGALRGSPATALQKTDRVGNPFGLPQKERLAWAAGLDVPLVKDNPEYEVLYWVGCAAAYDRRAQKIARSVVRLLQAADVNFAVLGPEERCTGESARRMGDELLFQQLAEQNVATLGEHRAKRIVAHCPHCVNSLRNDYPQAGGEYEVVHHSQLLSELVADGKLPAMPTTTAVGGSITYHDPCYLARANGITEEPRAVLAAVAGQGGGNADAGALPIIELPRNRRETSCCGGGGGRMWFDDAPSQRVGRGRVEEIVGSGAATVAVSCPFCLMMVGDGVAAEKPTMQVRDIAELLAEATLGPESGAANGNTPPSA
ncbi:heterodisulfide reductase-related iron-sulfur binding cluster [Lacipirellula limnantheis]|uniref:Succinate dehydrogenase/fumarate reductase iron-sulfur subunit n=1 Tax=Lacipirellula limnantheis TaxID=2528024 RepID=A0A517U0L4_9BACT|nr:heterodisulfide reductase-related iron-sulfur binding cluster [Lacipirellula limnantheis]QDT74162.1 succinate dehydrogenase/fumarate reductase iron-sulfur subunit [Lacipirellula limnantheis]